MAKREAITSTTSGSSSSSSSDIKEKVKEQSVSTLEAIRKVIAEEGLAGLYSGLSSSIVGIAATNTVFYLFCECDCPKTLPPKRWTRCELEAVRVWRSDRGELFADRSVFALLLVHLLRVWAPSRFLIITRLGTETNDLKSNPPSSPIARSHPLAVEESKAVLLRQKVARAGGAAATLSTLESMLSSTIAGAATTVLTNPM